MVIGDICWVLGGGNCSRVTDRVIDSNHLECFRRSTECISGFVRVLTL